VIPLEDVFFIIFTAIFLAELGDKTQLTTMTFATKYGWKMAFIGAVLALALVNFIGAVIGDKLGELLPADLIHKIAGALFVLFGVLMIIGKL
jgi:putative Ca2+/H+ antiporter (TMEM165/GDT1 family)